MTKQGKTYHLNWLDGMGSCEITDCLVVGRSQAILTFADDLTMSEKHAQFNIEDGQLYVIDLESASGTFVNGERIAEKTPVALNEGDSVKMGEYVFKIDVETDIAAATETPLDHVTATELADAAQATHFESPIDSAPSLLANAEAADVAAALGNEESSANARAATAQSTAPTPAVSESKLAASRPVFNINLADEYKKRAARNSRPLSSKKIPYIAATLSLLVFFVILFSGKKKSPVVEDKVAAEQTATADQASDQAEVPPVVPVAEPAKRETTAVKTETAKKEVAPVVAPITKAVAERTTDQKLFARLVTLKAKYKKTSSGHAKKVIEADAKQVIAAHYKFQRAAMASKLKVAKGMNVATAKKHKAQLAAQLHALHSREQIALSHVRDYLTSQAPAPFNAR